MGHGAREEKRARAEQDRAARKAAARKSVAPRMSLAGWGAPKDTADEEGRQDDEGKDKKKNPPPQPTPFGHNRRREKQCRGTSCCQNSVSYIFRSIIVAAFPF